MWQPCCVYECIQTWLPPGILPQYDQQFLELTTHTECCIYAIFEYFSSVRVGLDGLALSSDNKTHRFNFSPAVLSHLLVMCWATPSSSHLCFACS